jgi:hypothetical protein
MGRTTGRHTLVDDVGGRLPHVFVAVEGAQEVDRRAAVADQGDDLPWMPGAELVQQGGEPRPRLG